MSLADAIATHLSDFPAAPFLFVGSGLSRRYLGLESWRRLLERFSSPLPRPFEYYFSTSSGYLPRVASLMAKDFHELWWESDEFVAQRERHREHILTDQSALKIAIGDYV